MYKLLSSIALAMLLSGNIYAEDANPDSVTKLYVATFKRAPDKAGLNYWVNDSGLSLEAIATSFFDQDETKTLYPEGTSNRDFVKSVYDNLFNRMPEDAGWDYWVEQLDNHVFSKNRFIQAVIDGAKGDDAKILANKTEVGLAFAESNTDSNIIPGVDVMSNITADHSSVDDTFKGLFAENITPMSVNDSSVVNGNSDSINHTDSVNSTDSESSAIATDIIDRLDKINQTLMLTSTLYLSRENLARKIFGNTLKANSMLSELSEIVEEKNSLTTIARLGKILLTYSGYSFAKIISADLDGTIMLVHAIEDIDKILDDAYSYYLPGMAKPYFSNYKQIKKIFVHLSNGIDGDINNDGTKNAYNKWDFQLEYEGIGGMLKGQEYKGYYNIELNNGKHAYVPYGRTYYKFGYSNKDRLCGFSAWSWCW